MGADLKAENLTISVPNRGCDKGCEYCVSRMTGYVTANFDLMVRNIEKVKTVARAAEVTSILFTGKGEPTYKDAWPELIHLIDRFREFPLELQTNGIFLSKHFHCLSLLNIHGLDVIAVSMDSKQMFLDYKEMFKEISRLEMVSRITVNVTNKLGIDSFQWFMDYCIGNNVKQLTFRKIVKPEVVKHKATAEWIEKNSPDNIYNNLIEDALDKVTKHGRLIRTLRNGVEIWDYHNIAFSFSDYCIQERDNGDNLRSLVFQEDGHLYTGWGSRASILF